MFTVGRQDSLAKRSLICKLVLLFVLRYKEIIHIKDSLIFGRPILLSIASSSFFIFVTKLPDDRRLSISPAIILMRPLIIVLALVNKMGRTRLTRSKNIRSDSEHKLNLGPRLARIIHLYVGKHQAKMGVKRWKGQMGGRASKPLNPRATPIADLLIKG
jgi:hypothetical protein